MIRFVSGFHCSLSHKWSTLSSFTVARIRPIHKLCFRYVGGFCLYTVIPAKTPIKYSNRKVNLIESLLKISTTTFNPCDFWRCTRQEVSGMVQVPTWPVGDLRCLPSQGPTLLFIGTGHTKEFLTLYFRKWKSKCVVWLLSWAFSHGSYVSSLSVSFSLSSPTFAHHFAPLELLI